MFLICSSLLLIFRWSLMRPGYYF